jgi:hypothetical protein
MPVLGRPNVYNEQVADEICAKLESGQSLFSICKNPNRPSESTVRHWALEDRGGFSAKYTRARDLGLDAIADKMLEIARSAVSPEDVPRARLEFDAVRWYLSKLAPKRYGDAQLLKHADADGNVLKIELSRVEPRPARVIDVTPEQPALPAGEPGEPTPG